MKALNTACDLCGRTSGIKYSQDYLEKACQEAYNAGLKRAIEICNEQKLVAILGSDAPNPTEWNLGVQECIDKIQAKIKEV